MGEYDTEAVARLASNRALVPPIDMVRITSPAVNKEIKVGNVNGACFFACFLEQEKKKKKREKKKLV